ncbi:MAG: DNA polymerase III subunit delta [Oscillospiraceae bacterium]|jgi:DNA polymerase-3 subunit delta|nr:DNA polymerase III subunit delta [Oscillospiraceae bacterium]
MKAAKTDGLARLKQDLRAGTPARLYVFYGEESYLRQHYLAELKKQLVMPGFEGFNYEFFEGRGLVAERLQEAVEGLPAFAPRKLVVVRDLDLYKSEEALRSMLEQLLKDLPDTVCLVFIYDALQLKTDARTRMHTLLKAAGHFVEFAPQAPHDLIPWITRHFRAYGKQIDRALCEYLIFRCGDLMSGLKSEIDKIAAFAASDTVRKTDVDAVSVPVLDAVVYQMTDAITARQWARAMEILLTLVQMREEPIAVLAALGRQMRGLYAARLALSRGFDAGKVMRVMGYRSDYPARRLLQSARERSLSWCRRAVALCAQVDLELKSGVGRDRARALEWVVAALSEEGAGAHAT